MSFRNTVALVLLFAAFAVLSAPAPARAEDSGNYDYTWIDVNSGLRLDGTYKGLQSWYGICHPDEPNFIGLGETDPELAADDTYVEVDLPFTFFFYGRAFNKIYVTTNGVVSFSEPVKSDWYENEEFPTDNLPNAIAPFWDDIYPRDPYFEEGQGEVRYLTYGTAPFRMFIVEWYDVTDYDTRSDTYNIEVVLFESTNDILFLYRDMVGAAADGSSATIGLNTFAGKPYVQYSYAESVIPTGTGAFFGIYFTPSSNGWRGFGMGSEDVWATTIPTDMAGPCAVSDEVDGWLFAGYIDNYRQELHIYGRYGNTWSELPSLSDRIVNEINAARGVQAGDEGAFDPYFDNLQILNAGNGVCYVFVIVPYLGGFEETEFKQMSSSGGTILVACWEDGDWQEVGAGSLSSGILGDIYAESVCAALTPSGAPALAFSMSIGYYYSQPVIAYAYYDPATDSWKEKGYSMTNGVTPNEGGASYQDKLDHPAEAGAMIYYNYPSLAFSDDGTPWIVYRKSVYPDTGGEEYYVELRYFDAETDSWPLALYNGTPYSLPVLDVDVSPDIYIRGTQAIVGWYEKPMGDEPPKHMVMETPDVFAGVWTTLGVPTETEAGILPSLSQVAFDYFDRPLFCTRVKRDDGKIVLLVFRHEADGWILLSQEPEFGGLAALESLNFDFALDRCLNPIVINRGDLLYDTSYTPRIYVLHYVISFGVKPVEGESAWNYIVHEYGTDVTNLGMVPYFSEPGLTAAYTCGDTFLTHAVGTFAGGETLSVPVDSTNLSPGTYVDTIVFDIPFVYDAPPNIEVTLLKMGGGRTLRVPDEYATIDDALAAALPGDTILIGAGSFNTPQNVASVPNGITFRGIGVDDTQIFGDFRFHRTLWVKLENFTVHLPGAESLVDIQFEDVPGNVWVKNVLFDMPGGSASITGIGNVWFKNCTFGVTPRAADKADRDSSPSTFVVDGAKVSLTHCITPFSIIQAYPQPLSLDFCASGSLTPEYMGVIEVNSSLDGRDINFVDPEHGDFHLKSTTGHWDPGAGAFVPDTESSSLIDAGYAVLGPLNETMPHGFVINIGAYGGTSQASLSPYQLKSYTFTVPSGQYRMVAFPLYPVFNPPDPWEQFVNPFLAASTTTGTKADSYTTAYDTTKVRMFLYDSASSSYLEYPSFYLNPWKPGVGAWLVGKKADSSDTDITLSGMIPRNDVLVLPLEAGWNMVGEPYPRAISLNSLFVLLDEEKGIIAPLLDQNNPLNKIDMTESGLPPAVSTDVYLYDPTTNGYVKMDTSSTLPPFNACWIYAFRPVKLVTSALMPVKPASDMKVDAVPAPGLPPAPPSASFDASLSTGAGGGCFVATAAFGSLSAEAVRTLTSARDASLAESAVTSSLVGLYYAVSPEPASALRRSSGLRAVFRRLLSFE